MQSANQSEFAKAVCDALGLKNVTSLDISFRLNEPVIVTAEFFAEDGIETVLKHFVLSAEKKG